MKLRLRLLFVSLLAVFSLSTCSKGNVEPDNPQPPQPPEVTITIPATENISPSFSNEGGAATVSFTVNAAWTAKVVESGATWCTVSPASGGSGNHTLTINTAANDTPDSRTATVQLAAGTVTKTINITQKQKDALTVTSNKFDIPAEGGSIDIEAKANIELSYTISDGGKSWISYVETKALKTSHLIFKVASNDNTEAREAKITISGGGISEVITVVQAGKAPAEFKISQTEVEVGSEKSTFELVITSSIGYEVKPEVDWIKQISTSGSNGVYTHTFEVAENTTTDSREGIIVVCNDEKVCIPVTVKQKGAVELSVSKSEFNLGAEDQTIEVKVTGRVDIVTVPVSWIIQESVADGLYKFAVSKNEFSDSRSAEITFKNTAQNTEVKVKVTQSGVDVFSISTNSVEVDYEQCTFEVTVTSSMGYEIKPQVDWIKEVTSRTVSNNVHLFEVAENTSTDSREGIIVVCNDAQTCIPITVKQQGAPEDEAEWVTKEFFHKSLGMRFTADWCGYCPMMATAFDDAKKQLPGNLEVLSLHASGGLHSEVSESLANQYKVQEFPTGYVDGLVNIPNYNQISYTTSAIVDAVNATEKNYKTITGASWTSTVSGNKVSLNLNVYLKKAGSYKVTALLVEDNIVAYQNGASNSYNHNDIVRGAFTKAWGDSFSIGEDGKIKNFNYSLNILGSWNKDNLRIVVYIQSELSNGAYYINNAASAAVGKEQPLMIKSSNTGGVEGIVPGDKITF